MQSDNMYVNMYTFSKGIEDSTSIVNRCKARCRAVLKLNPDDPVPADALARCLIYECDGNRRMAHDIAWDYRPTTGCMDFQLLRQMWYEGAVESGVYDTAILAVEDLRLKEQRTKYCDNLDSSDHDAPSVMGRRYCERRSFLASDTVQRCKSRCRAILYMCKPPPNNCQVVPVDAVARCLVDECDGDKAEALAIACDNVMCDWDEGLDVDAVKLLRELGGHLDPDFVESIDCIQNGELYDILRACLPPCRIVGR